MPSLHLKWTSHLSPVAFLLKLKQYFTSISLQRGRASEEAQYAYEQEAFRFL